MAWNVINNLKRNKILSQQYCNKEIKRSIRLDGISYGFCSSIFNTLQMFEILIKEKEAKQLFVKGFSSDDVNKIVQVNYNSCRKKENK